MGFSGIPLGEQAKYTATTYLPALANLKSTFNQQGTSLTDALNGLNTQENQYAQQLRQGELDRDQQATQFQQQLAASRASAGSGSGSSYASPTFGGVSSQTPQPAVIPKNGKNGAGGFAFRDSNGAMISAAQYAKLTGTSLGDLLHQMGSQGDAYAQQAYNQISKNLGYYNSNPQALQGEFKFLF